ncbi:hypothetical protein HU200_036906 [Digitaria exilis]|uniref:Uncharacterized protein n=1 Tax=Digitaria exilis TaxID=1010633 RepID=A0A835ELK0_9POAL|nr:hypothetical protein HU200_036906 [Digitaria exilis]
MASHAPGQNGESAKDKASIWTPTLLPIAIAAPLLSSSSLPPPLFSLTIFLANFLPVSGALFVPCNETYTKREESRERRRDGCGGRRPFFDAWLRRGPRDWQRRRVCEPPETQRPSGIGHDEVERRSPVSRLPSLVHLVSRFLCGRSCDRSKCTLFFISFALFLLRFLVSSSLCTVGEGFDNTKAAVLFVVSDLSPSMLSSGGEDHCGSSRRRNNFLVSSAVAFSSKFLLCRVPHQFLLASRFQRAVCVAILRSFWSSPLGLEPARRSICLIPGFTSRSNGIERSVYSHFSADLRVPTKSLTSISCRYQRLSPDCLPLGNGGGGGGAVPRKSASSRSSFKDDDASAMATDGSRLASYLAATPHDSKPPLRARAPPPPPLSSSAAGRSPARDHHAHRDHHTSDSSDTTSPSSTGGGGGAVVGDVLLQWGHNKRSRCRRDSAAAATAPSGTQRRQNGGVGIKIQRRSSAPAEKLMPPPPATAGGGSYTRGSNLRSASSFPSRASASASTAAAGDARHHPPHHHRSVEERSGGGQKRSLPDKGHKSAMDAVLHMESKNHLHLHHHHDSPLTANGGAAAAGEKLGAERFELPRIYISLSRKEKEDDFLAMKGTKLPQRPKKRAKNVDKTLQFVFPGMWLSDLTKGRYEVREKKCVKKVQIQSTPIWSFFALLMSFTQLVQSAIIFSSFLFRVADD